MDNYQLLWHQVQLVQPDAAADPSTVQLQLEQYRSKLLNLFVNKVRIRITYQKHDCSPALVIDTQLPAAKSTRMRCHTKFLALQAAAEPVSSSTAHGFICNS
jgi:hypothetical protein